MNREISMWRAALIAGSLVLASAAYAADEPKQASGFALTSPDIAQGRKMASAQVFSSFGCTGENISRSLPSGALQGRTDFGAYAYGGPCPPPGKVHHYHFRLYALKVPKLDVPADASAAFIAFNVHANAIGETQIMAIYSR
jgi:phosphatidylethanolamine-binding protein (PEBP) family uncharacterized protein